MRYECVKVCFFRGRKWGLGESLTPLKDEKIPDHFKKDGGKKVKKPKKEEPKTMKDLHEEEEPVALSKPSDTNVSDFLD